jgi:hypothetical protein
LWKKAERIALCCAGPREFWNEVYGRQFLLAKQFAGFRGRGCVRFRDDLKARDAVEVPEVIRHERD